MIAALALSGDYRFISSREDPTSSPIGNFKHAVALAVDPMGNMYVLDAETNELLKVAQNGELSTSSGGYGWSDVAFDQPLDLDAPNGLDVYVADYGNHRIRRFDRNLNAISSLYFRENDEPEERFGYPRSVAVSRHGELFVVDGENIRVVKIINNNTFDRAFGGRGGGKGQLQNPSRIRISTNDLVYVQDGNAVKVFDIFGNYVRDIGAGIFSHIKTFTVSQDRIYVLDGSVVRAINEQGNIADTVAVMIESASQQQIDIMDIAVNGKILLALSSKHIYQQQIPDENTERKE